MKKNLLLAIILLTNNCFSQQYLDLVKKINEPETFYLNIDDIHSTINRSAENLVIFHGFYFDSDKLHQKSIYDCLPNYNPNQFLFHFQIYNGDLNFISLTKQINNKEKKEDLKHSALYIFSRSEDAISDFLKANLAEFSISLQETYKGLDIYKLEYISSQEEFCFRLNQMYNQIQKQLENIKKMEIENQPIKSFFSIGLNSAFGVWSDMKTFSDENFSSSRTINPSFFELGILSRLNINKSLFLNLEFSQSIFGITTSIDDGKYTIPVEHDFLNERIVYFENVRESASFKIYSFGIGSGYTYKFHNSQTGDFSLSLACIGRYYLPFTFSSELISGDFSYKGKSSFISQELENINDLNLSNNFNHSFFQPSVSEVKGFAISPSIQFNYAIESFTFYTGVNYLMNYWSVQNPMNATYISTSANEYNSSFMISEGIQNSILSLSFGVSYAIK